LATPSIRAALELSASQRLSQKLGTGPLLSLFLDFLACPLDVLTNAVRGVSATGADGDEEHQGTESHGEGFEFCFVCFHMSEIGSSFD